MSLGDSALEANTLCTECGLCCTGLLFSHVSVSEAEVERLRKRGPALFKRSNGKRAFRLPCSCFSKGRCTIYDARPAICANYYCTLQNQVMNGSLALDKALKIASLVRWQAGWLFRNAPVSGGREQPALNLRDFMYAFHDRMTHELGDRPPTEAERDYIVKTFECLKLVDRFFAKTSRLSRYARLIQSLPLRDRQDQTAGEVPGRLEF
ncbi:hypothetical protein JCM17960_04030 [Magnetospira thiophila]